jgi:nitrogenase molybdenum-cofactor synthesis protein NifE
MAILKGKASVIREKRLSTIGAYYGTVEAILREYYDGKLKQRVRTFSQDTNSDILYALQVINTIENVGIVIHGPRGCGIIQNHYNTKNLVDTEWAVTNIDEEDSILGSDRKLRKAVKSIFEKNQPKVIFVVTTAVVAINNDDVASVTQDLIDELGIPVVPIYTDGFRSKVGATGYDVAIHAIVKYLLPSQAEKQNFINVITINENKQSIEEINRLLEAVGVEINIFPRYAKYENLKKAGNAEYNLVIKKGEGDYFAKVLNEIYDIPNIEVNTPIGIKATNKWLTEIGKQLGKEQKVKELIEKESQTSKEELKKYQLDKIKVFLSIDPEYVNAVINLLEDLNAEVVGIKFPYLDISLLNQLEKLYKKNPELSLLIGEGQPYEQVNILKKTGADVYIGNDLAIDSITAGTIPIFNIQQVNILGYKGSISFAEKLHKLIKHNGFSQNFKEGVKHPVYQSGWLKKNANWYIKQEVK